jgi:hypothetical protein
MIRLYHRISVIPKAFARQKQAVISTETDPLQRHEQVAPSQRHRSAHTQVTGRSWAQLRSAGAISLLIVVVPVSVEEPGPGIPGVPHRAADTRRAAPDPFAHGLLNGVRRRTWPGVATT